MTTPNPNMTGSQIRKLLSQILDSLVIDNHPQVLDDDQPDLLADSDKRSDAINNLIKMIEFYREDL
jgi:hypothetical protein